MEITKPGDRLAEVQGPYGPLQVLEGKIQHVWILQQIQRGNWQTRSGASLAVRFPGHWNRGTGPDFKEAVILVNGEARIGDIEIHLYREDWWRHGHHLDPAYGSVMLHIVLFAGGFDRIIRTERGSTPEEWIMGPWMREDVESVVGGQPGLFGEEAPELREWVESEGADGIRRRLQLGADRRCLEKQAMGDCLLKEYGWSGALHRMMLYHLGYPFNRRAFFEMGERHPLENWRDRALLGILREQWGESVRWSAGRPANRAGRRLGEYIDLNRRNPDWSSLLALPPAVLLNHLHRRERAAVGDTPTVRRDWRIASWRTWVSRQVLGEVLGEGMTDRLWIDVFIPILMAGGVIDSVSGGILWFHTQAGSFPDNFREMLKIVGIERSRGYPLCNGWVQGLIWNNDQLRMERIRTALGSGVPTKPGLTS